jgi:adsorption protein B
LAQRIYFVNLLYGWEQALMSVPRMVVGNVVNFLATARAWRIFLGHLVFGKRLVWDKTMHDFPSTGQVARTRQRLGDLLSGWRAVTGPQLEAALAEQRASERPLGSILLTNGWLDDETLAEALAYQADLARSHPDIDEVRRNSERLALDLCVRWRVLALDDGPDGTPRIAAASPLAEDALAEIALAAGAPVLQTIARESEIVAGLRLMRGGDAVPNAAPLLGDVMVELGLINTRDFRSALAHNQPDRHGRIGDYLVEQGVVSSGAVERAIAVQRERTQPPAPHILNGDFQGMVPA